MSALGPNPSFFLFWGTLIQFGGLLGQGPGLGLGPGLDNDKPLASVLHIHRGMAVSPVCVLPQHAVRGRVAASPHIC